MAIDERSIELINADIDGEIAPDERAELDGILESTPEARSLHDELSSLCSTLDNEDMLEPPRHLRHVVMNQIPNKQQNSESRGWLQALLATPALRYAATFAAGVIITVVIADSGQIQERRFDDVRELVGTMQYGPAIASININKAEVGGTVRLHRADPMMVIDFELSTKGPIEIAASYSDKTVWFNGFAQLESTGTSISAEDGQITIQVDGNRRYAVFLHNADSRNVSINLVFFANGEVVHEDTLEYRQGS